MADETAESTASADNADERESIAPSTRTPRPGASAASRARRIGGRPAARPEGATADTPSTLGRAARPVSGRIDTKAEAKVSSAADTKVKIGTRANGKSEPKVKTATKADAAPPGLLAWLQWAPAAILTAGVIAMAIVVFVASNGVWRNKPSGSAQREEVLGAAKNCVATVSTYRYTELAAYRKRGLACAGGQFSKDFAKAVDTLITPQAPKIKAVQSAQINKGGLQSVVGGQWTVDVYGQVSVTNTSTPKGRLDPLSAVVRMERLHGKWVIVKLDLLNAS